MAKFKNFENTQRNINKTVIATIKQDVKPIVKKYLEDLIDKKVDANKKQFPKKKASTIKQYKKHGWNTKNWLKRSGEATKLVFKNLKNGLSVKPADPDDILQYVQQSDTWFLLNKEINDKIIKKIKEDLK